MAGRETAARRHFRLVFCPGAGSILLGVATAPRFLVVIGDWSYSIYLSHIFVIAALCRLLPVDPALGRPGGITIEVVPVAGVLLAGALSYHFLEAARRRITRRGIARAAASHGFRWRAGSAQPPPAVAARKI